MKADVVRLAAVILVVAASAAHAASETIIMNSIDANGIGKKVGTLDLSDTKAGLRVAPQLTDLPPGDHGFHIHVNPGGLAVLWAYEASQRTAWIRFSCCLVLAPAHRLTHQRPFVSDGAAISMSARERTDPSEVAVAQQNRRKQCGLIS